MSKTAVAKKNYFVVNDTRFDNHHGGLRVMANLHLAMARRGWEQAGSLPVSATVRHLRRHRRAIASADLIVINGEGSLHHNSRNAERLLAICDALRGRPMVLINALWQDNDAGRWQPVLANCNAIYTRDRRSQAQLQSIGVDAGYAPDLTFYHYPDYAGGKRSGYLCTDSVLKTWNEQAYALCRADPELEFATLLTRQVVYSRGVRDAGRQIKSAVYPWLYHCFRCPVPARYQVLRSAVNDGDTFVRSLAGYRAVCAARYHALCFALQQQVPVLAVASNAHKSEALLEEVGLPPAIFALEHTQIDNLKIRLAAVAEAYGDYSANIAAFNRDAKEKIDAMFDRLLTSVG